jgi:hypothetical protein
MRNPDDPSRAMRGFSRRGFLVGSTAVLGALAAGAGLVMRGDPEQYRALVRLDDGSVPETVVLSVKELAVLTAVVDRMLPPRPPFPTARELALARRIDKELGFHGEKLQSDMKSALFVLEHDGLVHASASRFCALSPDEQDERLASMAQGNDIERQVVNGIRILALFFYYADERTWPHIHYAGPLVAERKPPLADSRVVKIGGA